MGDEPIPRIETKVPQDLERTDANTVLAAVNTATAVVNTALAIHNAKQSGKQTPPPPPKAGDK